MPRTRAVGWLSPLLFDAGNTSVEHQRSEDGQAMIAMLPIVKRHEGKVQPAMTRRLMELM